MSAALVRRALIFNLPGSPKAVRESLAVIATVLSTPSRCLPVIRVAACIKQLFGLRISRDCVPCPVVACAALSEMSLTRIFRRLRFSRSPEFRSVFLSSLLHLDKMFLQVTTTQQILVRQSPPMAVMISSWWQFAFPVLPIFSAGSQAGQVGKGRCGPMNAAYDPKTDAHRGLQFATHRGHVVVDFRWETMFLLPWAKFSWARIFHSRSLRSSKCLSYRHSGGRFTIRWRKGAWKGLMERMKDEG